jgi:hypothetical protein
MIDEGCYPNLCIGIDPGQKDPVHASSPDNLREGNGLGIRHHFSGARFYKVNMTESLVFEKLSLK